jgi:predicted permease
MPMIVEDIAQDVRFGLRTLAKNPGFTIVAVVSLALATGATTAIFSVVNSVLLRPLPYVEPDRLVQITGSLIQRDDLEALRRQSHSFESFAEYSPGIRNLRTASGVERLTAVVSDRDLFAVLGTAPIAGRTFRRDDGSVAVVSERLWRSRMSGDPQAIGETLMLDDRAFTVVGVMPDAFQFPYGAASILGGTRSESYIDVWIAEYRPLRSRLSRLVARLKAGVPPPAAAAELAVVDERRAVTSPGQQRTEPLRVVPYSDAVLGSARRALWLLFGAVALVLVAACANVANLLLALAGNRMHEVATRAALGASRARLVRQFMVESVLVALTGGAVGVVVARWTSDVLIAFGSERIPRVNEAAFDWSVFAFLLFVCLLTAIFFGLAPSLVAGGVDAGMVTREAGRATAGRVHARVRDVLVVGEVALAFVLASGAALMVAEMERLRNSNNGMVTANVVTVHLGQPLAPGVELQYQEIADRVSRLPEVVAAGFTQVLPLQNWGWNSVSTDFIVKGAPPRSEPAFPIELRYVTPGYFDALGISIRRGRGFLAGDTRNAPPVILINEALARRYFGDENPVGVVTNRGQIAGVVGDVSQVALDRPAVPEIYYPMAQNWSQVAELGVTLVVRSRAAPDALIGAVRARVREVNPQIAVFNPRTMEQVVSDSLWTLDLYRWLIGWFAALTLLLAAVGLYGVISCSVTARFRECAVRLALGSSPTEVARMVLTRGVLLSGIGIAAGCVLTLIGARVLGPDLPAVADAPVSILVAVAMLLLAIALCASWLPARRVSKIAPAFALKSL